MAVGFATAGRARQWGIDRARWEERNRRAWLTGPAEPAERSLGLFGALSRGWTVRVAHPNGTGIELDLAGARPRPHDGTPQPKDQRYGPSDMLPHIPGGRIDAALDSRTVEGRIRANRRTDIW